MDLKYLNMLVELASHQAEQVLIKEHQDLMPTWVLVNKDYQLLIIGTPWENDQQKKLTEITIRQEIRKHQAIAYSFVVEAWAASYCDQREYQKTRPQDRVDRQEVVISFATDGRQIVWKNWAIRRNHLDLVVALDAALPINKDDSAEGWMTQLLKEEKI